LGSSDPDIFIEKLDTAGNFKWAKRIGRFLTDHGTSIISDNFGNIFTTGSFSGTTDFNPDSLGTFYLTASGTSDIFILKLDSLGNFVWVKQMGGP